MIKVLGLKRIIVIAVLIAVNAVFAGALYYILTPEKTNQQQQLSSLRGQVSGLNRDLDNIKVEFEQLEEQREEFGVLKEDGFFKNQDRRQAEKVLNLIQKRSKVSKAQISIGSGKLEENEQAKKAKHKILKSPVAVRIEAMNDVDVFRYIFLLEKYFPGHIGVKTVKMERGAEVNGTVLRGIAGGQNVPLVTARIEFEWRTMIPEEVVIGEGQ